MKMDIFKLKIYVKMKRKFLIFICALIWFFWWFYISLENAKEKRILLNEENYEIKRQLAKSFYHKIQRPIKINEICCVAEKWENCFDIELAIKDEERHLWLMYRDYLPEFSWMLFIFEKSEIHSFWMKNTLIPLAWIWLDENLKVVDVIPMNPCVTEQCESYVPWDVAKYVLEINQNLINDEKLFTIWSQCYLK